VDITMAAISATARTWFDWLLAFIPISYRLVQSCCSRWSELSA
jgi:hypothetical protein